MTRYTYRTDGEMGEPTMTKTAIYLASLQHRKTRAVFARQVAREAARLGVSVDALTAAIHEAHDLSETRRRAEQAAAYRDQDRLADEAEQWDAAPARLEAAGWALTHVSESGSRYYARAGQTLRLADHLVPASPERAMAAADHGYQPLYDHEILAGQRGWRLFVDDVCK